MISTYQDIVALEQSAQPNSEIESTYALIARSALRYPDEPALSFFKSVEDHSAPATWTYAQLFADITRAANLFRRLGVQRGDVVALVMPNLPETHIVTWGAQTAGIAFAVNSLLEGAQIAELVRAAKARWIVTVDAQSDPQMWQRVEQASAQLPQLQGVLVVDGRRHVPGRLDNAVLPEMLGTTPVLDFHAELITEPCDGLRFFPPEEQDIAGYFCTGGTTGLPKIARHRHRNEVCLCGQLDAVVGHSMLRHGRTTLTALPLFHVNALIGTGLAVFANGGHVLLATADGFRSPGLIQRFWEIVHTHAVSGYSAVPPVYAALLQVPAGDWSTESLTAAICGAAPMPMDLLRRFEQQSGQRVLEGYGLTEGTCASSINPFAGESCIGSIGLRLPWQDMRVMILDPQGEWLRDAESDEVGAICISGPNVFAGYLEEAHNQEIWFETPAADGRGTQCWFNTGDLGRRDGQGYFWLTGRKKELIIRGGHNIDPKSIEEVMATHPAVAMCAAVGRPDAYAGEVPVVYAQLRSGCEASPQALLDYAGQHITERAAVPKAVILLQALPLTGVGKIFKPALNMREIEFVVRREADALDIELLDVQVEQVAKLGLVARYRSRGESDALARVLGDYTFVSQRL